MSSTADKIKKPFKEVGTAVKETFAPSKESTTGSGYGFNYAGDFQGAHLEKELQRSNPAPQQHVDARGDKLVGTSNERPAEGATSAVGGGSYERQSENLPSQLRDPTSGTVDDAVAQQTSTGSARADHGGGTFTKF